MFDLRPLRIHAALCLLALVSIPPGCAQKDLAHDPEYVLAKAVAMMMEFNFNQARDLLLREHKAFPEDSPHYTEYAFRLATAYWHATPPVKAQVLRAETLYEQVAARHPDSPFAPAAWLYLGRIRELRDFADDAPRFPEARSAYEALMARYPQSQEAGEAAVRHAVSLIKESPTEPGLRAGADALAAWLEANPDRLEASPVALFLATTHDYFFSDKAGALRYYQVAEKLGFVSQVRVGGYYWRMHNLALDLGKTDLAIQYAQRIVRDHTRSGRGYEAVKSLERIREAHPELEVEIPELKLFDTRKGGNP